MQVAEKVLRAEKALKKLFVFSKIFIFFDCLIKKFRRQLRFQAYLIVIVKKNIIQKIDTLQNVKKKLKIQKN